MKWEDVEKRLGDYVNSREDTVSSNDQTNSRRETVWNHIKMRNTAERKIKTFRLIVSVAAGILVLFSLSYLITIAQKNKEISRLALELSSLKDRETNLTGMVSLLQVKINDLSTNQSDIKNSEPIIEKSKQNRTVLPVQNTIQISISKDSLYRILLTDPIFSDFFMTEIRKPVLAENIITNELYLTNMEPETTFQDEALKKGVVHYKIDYGNIRTENDSIQRPWKVTITYQ